MHLAPERTVSVETAMETAISPITQECPLCGSELSQVKFLEIQAKLRVEEERRLKQAKVEADKVLAQERKKLAETRGALEAKASAAEEALKKTKEENRELLQKATETLERVKAESKEATEKAVAKAEQKKEQELAKKAQAELQSARAALKAEHDKDMLKKVGEENRKTEAALKKVKELERKLEAKTANELGDGAEIDVYEALKAAFEPKGDKVKRVPKGQPGPDIIHEVFSKGEQCGKIVLDSKNRQGWQNAYTAKLREDKIESKADYAILPTTAFPKDKRELCIQDEVIVMSPARVVEMVRILRQGLVRLHQTSKSNEERGEKKAKLYDYINSEQFRQKFEQASTLTNDLLEIDAKEHDAHTKVWEKRNGVVKKMQSALGDLDDDISAIVHASQGA